MNWKSVGSSKNWTGSVGGRAVVVQILKRESMHKSVFSVRSGLLHTDMGSAWRCNEVK